MRRTLLLLVSIAVLARGLAGQQNGPRTLPPMVDPVIDEGAGPFSYFSHPTDVIGVMDGRGTEVTPEGWLYTGFGELMFFAGPTLTPVEQRIRTLRGGWLPIIEYDAQRGDVAYHFTLFAATLNGQPESPVVDFVRVTMTNRGTAPTRARLAFAVRYTAPSTTGNGVGDNRFRRPAAAARKGQYEQPGTAFDTAWTYGFADGAFLRGGRVMYLYPTTPQPELRVVIGQEGSRASSIPARRVRVQETTPVGVTVRDTVLAPGASTDIVVKLPCTPVAPDDTFLNQVRAAGFDDYLARTESFWRGIAARGMRVSISERKVGDTFNASLVYNLIARDKRGDDYVQTVNEFHYHAFWLRDASYIAREYDVTGYPDLSRQVLDFFAGWQQPDGNFVSQGGQYDGWGQTLWAYGQHYRLTRDRVFAERVLPAVRRAVDWLRTARAGDSLHLVPATTPGDNEEITGHVTGHDFWALAGLHGAIDLAEAAGHADDARAFRREYDSLKQALLDRLRVVTASTGGYIPPGLDKAGGYDWGNMMAVYPEPVLDAHDAMVTATLDTTRARYAEGIMTYADGFYLHDYLTMKNTETEVVRGDQQNALEELYAVLVHTSSTHAGFEYTVRPWGNRDFGGNLSPHGWYAAKYRALLRDMLVREAGSELHLLSVLSPAWLNTGDSVTVRAAPTEFGTIGFALDMRSDSAASLTLDSHFARNPSAIVLHLPWFMETRSATANGRKLAIRAGQIRLSPGTRRVELTWRRQPDTPSLSYDAAVRDYKQEYRRRWEAWLRGSR